MALSDLLKATANYLTNKAKEAVDWYKKQIARIGRRDSTNDPDNVMKTVSVPEIGKMYLYYYDPKWKDVLPYWDQYPLVIVLNHYSDGFLGLNLHYLPHLARVVLLTNMYDTLSNPKFDAHTRFTRTYGDLKAAASKYNGYEQCIKRYLFSHVRSSYHEINPVDWEKVAMLNLQKWNVNPNRRYGKRPPY